MCLRLHRALQLHRSEFLTFSTTSFHLTRSWLHFVQLFILIILKYYFISFPPFIFCLPANLLDTGFHSYNFFTNPTYCHSFYMAKPATPYFTSFSPLIFGLPANLLDTGFHSYNFFTNPTYCHSFYMAITSSNFGPYYN